MKRRSAVLALALLCTSLSQAGAGTGRDPALLWLSEALAAPSTVSYSGVMEISRHDGSASERSVCRIEHRAPGLSVRTYSAPQSFLGDSVVTKGEVNFAIDRKRRRIVESRNDAPDDRLALRENVELVEENYRAVEKGNETFDGRQTVDILLINRYSHRRTMFVRIDRESKLVLDKQEYGDDGTLVAETRFEEVRYAAVSPADFALPKDYAVVAAETLQESSRDPHRPIRDAGFAAREPRPLPDGFTPLEGDLLEMRGARTVALLYSDGVRTVSLFESATAVGPDMTPFHPQAVNVDGRNAEYAVDQGVALLAWSDGSLHYTLVGELGLPELQRLADTISL